MIVVESVLLFVCVFSLVKQSRKHKRSEESQKLRKEKKKEKRQKKFYFTVRQQTINTKAEHKHYLTIQPPPNPLYKWKLISKNHILFNETYDEEQYTENMLDIVFLKKFFEGEYLALVDQLDKWGVETAQYFISEAKKKKNNSRGEYSCVCFGMHEQVGHHTVHVTPASLHEQGNSGIALFNPLWDKIAVMLQFLFPVLSAKLLLLPTCDRIFGLLNYGMFHLTPIQKCHIDWNDLEICVVFVLHDDFEGGHLLFRYLNLEFNLKKGDVIIFRSAKLFHELTKVIGNRRSMVLTVQRSVYNILLKTYYE